MGRGYGVKVQTKEEKMKKDEKLLREYIRESIKGKSPINELNIRVGDLRDAMKYAKGKNIKNALAQVSKEAGKKGVALGLKALVSLIPGAGAVASAIETGAELKDLYDAAASVSPEEKKKNPVWDTISIDPDTSAIVDDALEEEFIKLLRDRIKYLDDDDELPDADSQLNNFLKNKFNKAHVTKEG